MIVMLMLIPLAFPRAFSKANSRNHQRCAKIAKYAVATQVQPNAVASDARSRRVFIQQRAGMNKSCISFARASLWSTHFGALESRLDFKIKRKRLSISFVRDGTVACLCSCSPRVRQRLSRRRQINDNIERQAAAFAKYELEMKLWSSRGLHIPCWAQERAGLEHNEAYESSAAPIDDSWKHNATTLGPRERCRVKKQ